MRRKTYAAISMCVLAIAIASVQAQQQRNLPRSSGAEQLLQQALEEYKAASAIGHRDFASSQRKYIHAVYLLEELTFKYPSFLHMDRVLLLEGKCKSKIGESGEGDAFIKQHAADYQHFEVAGLQYTGNDFSLLISKFPRSPLVPDAAYELAWSKVFPECESEWDCYLRRVLDRFEAFIRQYPASPRVRDAIRSINADGFRYLDELAKDKIGGPGDMARRFEIQLDRYDALSKQLDTNRWAEAVLALANAHAALRDNAAARVIYSQLLEKLPRHPQAPTWRLKVQAISQPANSGSGGGIVPELYSTDQLKVLSAARLIASSRDQSYLPDVERWISQNRQLADLQEENSLCELLSWTFQQDPQFIYARIADWQGGGLCVWSIPDPTLPRRIMTLADEGHVIKWTAAREALRRLPESEVIRSLSHRERAVRRGAIFIVMQKKYSRAVPQLWRIIGEDIELNEEVGSALAEIDSRSEICYRVLWLFRVRTVRPNLDKRTADWLPIMRLQKLVGFSPPLDAQNQPVAKERLLSWWRTNRSGILGQIAGMPDEIRRELERL